MAESFELNFQDLYEIDTTPLTTATYVRLGVGIATGEADNNENLAQDSYLDGEGFGSTDVIGAQHIVSFSGHRVIGNTAQDYVAAMKLELGDARKTRLRYTDAAGNVISGNVTLANIKDGGGEAGAKKDFSFEAHFNGKPTYTAKTAAAALTATVAASTVTSGCTKFTATPAGTDTLSYKISAVSAGIVYAKAYVAGDIAYTSGADIPAVAGQYLQCFEIDTYSRVVKFYEKLLVSGDIKA
jgi:hypothetical protein